MTADEFVRLLKENAAELRAVGVSSFQVEGASAVLMPLYPGEAGGTTAGGPIPPGRDEPALNPLDDPATFGGVLPGYDFPASPPAELE